MLKEKEKKKKENKSNWKEEAFPWGREWKWARGMERKSNVNGPGKEKEVRRGKGNRMENDQNKKGEGMKNKGN